MAETPDRTKLAESREIESRTEFNQRCLSKTFNVPMYSSPNDTAFYRQTDSLLEQSVQVLMPIRGHLAQRKMTESNPQDCY